MANWWKRALGLSGRERATALVTQGVVHARQGKVDEAKRAYQEAVDADEELAVAHLNLGLARLDLFNRDHASLDDDARATALAKIAAALDRALALDASTAVGWRALAHVEERRGAWARADDAWGRVLALSPTESAAAAEARQAKKDLEKKAAADRARLRALQALDAATPSTERVAALAELLPFVDEPGLVLRGHALAGTLARRAGDRAQARALLEKAASASVPADVDALRELASIALEDGDLPRALAASMAAYRESPTDAALVCNVGVCHLGLGDLDQAAEFIEIAHNLDPRDPIVLRAREALALALARARS